MYMGSIILRRSMHITETDTIQMYTYTDSGADPGFPVGGGCQPSRRRAPAYKFARFSEKLHEIKKMLVRRGGSHWISHYNYNRESRIVCVCGGGGVHARRACTRSTNDNGFQTRSEKNVLGVLSLESILPHCV